MLVLAILCPAHADQPSPAVVTVHGYRWRGNRQLRESLELLQTGKTPPATYNASYVEDAALVLLSSVTRDGYLQPRLEAELTLADGEQLEFQWDDPAKMPMLPRPLAVKRLRFIIRRGVLFHYRQVSFSGLTRVSEKDARGFFIEPGSLIPLS
jgi:hypothetical protein